MKRLLRNFRKDWKIGFRTHYVWITLGTVVLFFLFMQFLLPDSYSQVTVYQYIDPSFGEFPLMEAVDAAEESAAGTEELLVSVDNRDAVYESMAGNTSSYGLIIEKGEGALGKPLVTVVMPGSAGGDWARLVELEINTLFSMGVTMELNEETIGEMTEYPTTFPSKILYPELRDLPFRDNFLPAFLVMESSLIGLFLLAVMLFAEKEQRMHTAYLVSPAGLTEHLLSKVMVMMCLGYISSFAMTLMVRGFSANYWLLFVVITAGSFISSSIGLFMGAVFNSLQKAMMIVIAMMFIMMMPLFSFLFPNFSPMWVRIIPTYHLLFAARDAVLPYFGTSGVYRAAGILVLEGIVIFMAARIVYERALWAKS